MTEDINMNQQQSLSTDFTSSVKEYLERRN